MISFCVFFLLIYSSEIGCCTVEDQSQSPSCVRVPWAVHRCATICYYDNNSNTHLNGESDCSNHHFLLFLFSFFFQHRKKRRNENSKPKYVPSVLNEFQFLFIRESTADEAGEKKPTKNVCRIICVLLCTRCVWRCTTEHTSHRFVCFAFLCWALAVCATNGNWRLNHRFCRHWKRVVVCRRAWAQQTRFHQKSLTE